MMERGMIRGALLAAGVVGGCAAGVTSVAHAAPWQVPIASSYGAPGSLPADPMMTSARQLEAQVGPAAFTAPDFHPGVIRHMVMFRYKPTTTDAQRAEITARFLRLVQDSRRPDGSRFVQSIETGMQDSGEGNDAGLQQAFLVTFRSEGDRNFYVGRPVVTDPAYFDPAHEAFKQFAAPYLAGVVVFDYPVTLVDTAHPAPAPHHRRRS